MNNYYLTQDELQRICEALVFIVEDECYAYNHDKDYELAREILEHIYSNETIIIKED